jgi:hypothetical protein
VYLTKARVLLLHLQMSPYLVLETDDDKQKTDVADDAGESA